MLAFCCEQCGNNRTTSDQEACHPGPGGGIHKLCATPLRARARASRPPSLRAKRRDCPSRPTALLPPLVGKSTYRQLLDDDSRRVGRSQSGQPQKPARQPAGQRPNEPDPVGRLLLPLRPRHSPSQPVLRSLMMRATRRGREQRPRRAMTGGGPQKQSQRGQKEREGEPEPEPTQARHGCCRVQLASARRLRASSLYLAHTCLPACLLRRPACTPGRTGKAIWLIAMPCRQGSPGQTQPRALNAVAGRELSPASLSQFPNPRPPSAKARRGCLTLWRVPSRTPSNLFYSPPAPVARRCGRLGHGKKIVEIKNVGFDVVVLLSSMP